MLGNTSHRDRTPGSAEPCSAPHRTAPHTALACAPCPIRNVWEYACRHPAWNQALPGVGRPDQEQPSMARLYRCHRVPGSAEPCSAPHPTQHSRAPPARYEAFGIMRAGIWPGTRRCLAWGDRIKSSRAWLGIAPRQRSHTLVVPSHARHRTPCSMRVRPRPIRSVWHCTCRHLAWSQATPGVGRPDQEQPSMARLYRLGGIKSSRAWLGSTD